MSNHLLLAWSAKLFVFSDNGTADLMIEVKLGQGIFRDDAAVNQGLLQAKDKEQAVLYLYRMYGLEPVKYSGSLI